MKVKKITKPELDGDTYLIAQAVNHNAEVLESALDRIKELEKDKPYEEEQEPTLDRDCEHCSKTYGTLGCCDCVSNKWVYSCKEGQREYLLNQIRAEVEAQEKWLAEAGYNAYNVSVAFGAIKHALGKLGQDTTRKSTRLERC